MIVLDSKHRDGGHQGGGNISYQQDYSADEGAQKEPATVAVEEEASAKEVKPAKKGTKKANKPASPKASRAKEDKKSADKVNPDDIPF